MSAAASTLPAGWASILDEIHLRLDHAVAAANERLEQLPHVDVEALAHERRQEITKWHDRLQRLNEYLASAEQIVHSVGDVLLKEETHLRDQLGKSGVVRQKLAAAAGRAIG